MGAGERGGGGKDRLMRVRVSRRKARGSRRRGRDRREVSCWWVRVRVRVGVRVRVRGTRGAGGKRSVMG